jgi:hypothetical protein
VSGAMHSLPFRKDPCLQKLQEGVDLLIEAEALQGSVLKPQVGERLKSKRRELVILATIAEMSSVPE